MMATYTVRLDGTGDYTSISAALIVAGNPGDIVSVTEEGTYPNEQWTGLSAPAPNVTVQNDSGGVVTVQDVAARATYMIDSTGGLALKRLRLAWGSSYARVIDAVSGLLVLEDVEYAPTQNAVTTYLVRTGSAVTQTRCRPADGVAWSAMRLYAFGVASTITHVDCDWTDNASGLLNTAPAGSTVTFRRCRWSQRIWNIQSACTVALDGCYSTTQLIRAQAGTNGSLTVDACGSGLIAVEQTGGTITTLTIRGTYSPTLVSQTGGTISAFAGAHNVYSSTAAGTTSATDRTVTGAEDLRLGGASGIEPTETSALLDVIPVGVNYGASTIDLLGFPRLEGGRQTVGPVQARLPRARPAWRKMARASAA